MEALLCSAPQILMEGSVYERLRRHPEIIFDPFIAHAGLVYPPVGSALLEEVHREYWEVGQRYRLPMIALTDTWRASQERVERSGFARFPVNEDNVRFLTGLRSRFMDNRPPHPSPVLIAGQIGPYGDAYRPLEAPGRQQAERLHAWQVEALAGSGVDLLAACTLPAFPEAQAIAGLFSRTGLPYFLSFVIRPQGTLLDGTLLYQAIETIDQQAVFPPFGYSINCVHPGAMLEGLRNLEAARPGLSRRIAGFQANTSPRSPEELDGLVELESEAPATLAAQMLQVQQQYGVRILGGCCGCGTQHIEHLARCMTSGCKPQDE